MANDNENKKGEGGAEEAAKAAKDAAKEAKKAKEEAGRARSKKAKEEAAAGAMKIAAPGETKVSPSKSPRLQTQYRGARPGNRLPIGVVVAGASWRGCRTSR